MASLSNTSWKFTANQHDFTTFTASFDDSGKANISFSTGVKLSGAWTEGVNGNSFSLNFTTSGHEVFNIVGALQDKNGSGVCYIGWSGGVQISPFSMTS